MKRVVVVGLGILGAVGLACGADSGVPPAERAEYQYLRDGMSGGEVGEIWAALPYSRVTLQRGGCFGPCPIYTVTFTRGTGAGSGGAAYEGGLFADRSGTFEGELDIYTYGRLCLRLDELGFRFFRESYTVNGIDLESVNVEAETTSGTRRVEEYGSEGPRNLHEVQRAIDAVADGIEWHER